MNFFHGNPMKRRRIAIDTKVSRLPITPLSTPVKHKVQQRITVADVPEIVANIVFFLDLEHASENTIHNYRSINRLWNCLIKDSLARNLVFNSTAKLRNHTLQAQLPCKRIIFYRLTKCQETDIERIFRNTNLCNLQTISFHLCPNIAIDLFNWTQALKLSSLTKLVVTANNYIDDGKLSQLATLTPNLQTLDLRSCHSITDVSIVQVVRHCKFLEICNLGRTSNGQGITDVTVMSLSNLPNINTVGLSGCNVTDAGLWELVSRQGSHLQRLSLSNCHSLTNNIVSTMFLSRLPLLQVLDIKNIDNITNVDMLVRFKIWHSKIKLPLLIRSCDRLTKLIIQQEQELQNIQRFIALQDMTWWVNTELDEHLGQETYLKEGFYRLQ